MRKLLLITSILIGISGPVMAWDNTITGPGNNQIVDQGGTGSQNVNHNVSKNNLATNSTATATVGNVHAGGAKVNNTNNVNVNSNSGNGDGGSDYSKMPVSSAIAPSFGVGSNPCSGAAGSVAGQFPVFGLSFGGTEMDDVCRAQKLGENDVAREVMCDNSRAFRNAAYRVNRPCMVDGVRWNEEHPKIVPVVAITPITPEHKFVPSSWCKTASVKVRKANPLSCGS